MVKHPAICQDTPPAMENEACEATVLRAFMRFLHPTVLPSHDTIKNSLWSIDIVFIDIGIYIYTHVYVDIVV